MTFVLKCSLCSEETGCCRKHQRGSGKGRQQLLSLCRWGRLVAWGRVLPEAVGSGCLLKAASAGLPHGCAQVVRESEEGMTHGPPVSLAQGAGGIIVSGEHSQNLCCC